MESATSWNAWPKIIHGTPKPVRSSSPLARRLLKPTRSLMSRRRVNPKHQHGGSENIESFAALAAHLQIRTEQRLAWPAAGQAGVKLFQAGVSCAPRRRGKNER